MKKLISTIFLFLTFSTSILAAKIKSVEFNSKNFIVELSSLRDEESIISVDEDSKLIYIELQNLDKESIHKISYKIEKKMQSSRIFKEISIEKDTKAIYITLQLEPKVYFFVTSSKKEIKVKFRDTPKNKPLIIIDPGHGGKDPGALKGKVREKDIVLAVSRLLTKELKGDFDIIMTRDKDFFVQLHRRPKIGNENNAKLFVSIHANAALNKKANGVEVFYFSKKSSPYAERIASFENSFGEKFGESSSDIAQISGELAYKKNQEKSIKLANNIVHKVSSNLPLRNGKIHGANFAVLRGFNGTGVLIELGFITNKNDVRIISSKKYQILLAKQIAKSIREYFE